MPKKDYSHGHASLSDFIYWMTERHTIYKRRAEGVKWPWTTDPILQEYKFTNTFRELDTGTLHLRLMLKDHEHDEETTLFNVIWYRMLNRFEHADAIGFCESYAELEERALTLDATGAKMFTNAHLTVGVAGERKILTVLKTMKEVWRCMDELICEMRRAKTLQGAFLELRDWQFTGIGPFIGYEIISDLRWTTLLDNADDIMTWANLGPGCKRGLDRLGMPHTQKSLELLLAIVKHNRPEILRPHLERSVWPPFEMREIEHSLCEFDKYQRVKTGAGRPRLRYSRPTS